MATAGLGSYQSGLSSNEIMARKCPTCGRSARPNDRFCGACGRSLPKGSREEPLVCTDCGAEVEDESNRFCTNCGSKFEN